MNSERVFSVAGKTFLLGEYVALDGGPSILLTTGPRFSLHVHESRRSSKSPFASLSPAGRFLARFPAAAAMLEFTDPQRGKGGLGASSAQFALAYGWSRGLRRPFNWSEILDEYRACSWNGEGVPPSGADVVGQLSGGICWFDGRAQIAERLPWDFPSLSFTLLRTGTKLATHEHLKTPPTIPHEILRECVGVAKRAFLERDEISLVTAVERGAGVLAEAGLTASATQGLLRALRTQVPSVRSAKGCGAMGADVILVLHDRGGGGDDVSAWAESKGLEVCGTEADLDTDGFLETGAGK